jgi:hypothetical protein
MLHNSEGLDSFGLGSNKPNLTKATKRKIWVLKAQTQKEGTRSMGPVLKVRFWWVTGPKSIQVSPWVWFQRRIRVLANLVFPQYHAQPMGLVQQCRLVRLSVGQWLSLVVQTNCLRCIRFKPWIGKVQLGVSSEGVFPWLCFCKAGCPGVLGCIGVDLSWSWEVCLGGFLWVSFFCGFFFLGGCLGWWSILWGFRLWLFLLGFPCFFAFCLVVLLYTPSVL